MAQQTIPDAWVRMPDPDEFLAAIRERGGLNPYDFGFFPAMGRLIAAHGRIGPAFGTLFAHVMFHPDGHLSRAEREMLGAVTSAAQDCHY